MTAMSAMSYEVVHLVPYHWYVSLELTRQPVTLKCLSRGEHTWANKLSAIAPVFAQPGSHTASGTLLARTGESAE